MPYTSISSGVYTNIPRNGLYQLNIYSETNVLLMLGGDSGASTISDAAFNVLGSASFPAPVQLDSGAYIVNAIFNSTLRALYAYIPSRDSYKALPSLETGAYKASSWANFYKLMLDEDGMVFIGASGDNARSVIYDEDLNFVAHATWEPLLLGAGNYIVIAYYNGYKNGVLSVNVEDSMLADFDDYEKLHQILPINNDNIFVGSDGYALDVVHGMGGNDSFMGKKDWWNQTNIPDRFFGGAGVDTAIYVGSAHEYKISKTQFTIYPSLKGAETFDGIEVKDSVSSRDGTDLLHEVERLKFKDKNIAFDIDGNAGKVAKILASVFGRQAIANKEYAGIGLNLLDGGTSYEALAALAINVSGAHSREAVVDLLWSNLMGVRPTAIQAKPFVDMLATDLGNVGVLGVIAAEYSVTIGVVDLIGLGVTGLEFV